MKENIFFCFIDIIVFFLVFFLPFEFNFFLKYTSDLIRIISTRIIMDSNQSMIRTWAKVELFWVEWKTLIFFNLKLIAYHQEQHFT